jgi:hypothetical protein
MCSYNKQLTVINNVMVCHKKVSGLDAEIIYLIIYVFVLVYARNGRFIVT